MPPLLSIQHITKTYKNKYKVLTDVSLDVLQGEFISLVGPSGCGKTTLLSTLAGFLRPDAGTVHIDGQDVTALPPNKRALNTVFQNYALFPHMTVLENVSYGPLRSGDSKAQAAQRARESLELVGLEQFGNRYPAQMSGGQRQRVALARAIVNRPKLLLLDEPLSALDLKLRKRMQRELKTLQERLGISFIFVTHDQEEAMSMSDRIVVMHQGRIEQIGSGDHIYREPATRFVAEFIGDANLVECTVDDELIHLHCAQGEVTIPRGQSTEFQGRGIAVIRPEHVQIDTAAASPDAPEATVTDIASIGSYTTLYLDLKGTRLESRRLGADDWQLKRGDSIRLTLARDRIHLIGA